MKHFLFFVFFLGVAFVNAEQQSYSLHDNQTGRNYVCSPGGGGAQPVDPTCITDIRAYCHDRTSYSSETCFGKATQACKNGARASCVIPVAQDCRDRTSYSSERCFDEAVSACGGSASAIQGLMQESRVQSLLQLLSTQK